MCGLILSILPSVLITYTQETGNSLPRKRKKIDDWSVRAGTEGGAGRGRGQRLQPPRHRLGPATLWPLQRSPPAARHEPGASLPGTPTRGWGREPLSGHRQGGRLKRFCAGLRPELAPVGTRAGTGLGFSPRSRSGGVQLRLFVATRQQDFKNLGTKAAAQLRGAGLGCRLGCLGPPGGGDLRSPGPHRGPSAVQSGVSGQGPARVSSHTPGSSTQTPVPGSRPGTRGCAVWNGSGQGQVAGMHLEVTGPHLRRGPGQQGTRKEETTLRDRSPDDEAPGLPVAGCSALLGGFSSVTWSPQAESRLLHMVPLPLKIPVSGFTGR